jgi:hypothetical protein
MEQRRKDLRSSDAFKDCFDFSIGDGWMPLVEQLTKDLLAIYPELRVKQVKEKFGSLRYYIEGVPEEQHRPLHDLINTAERASTRICELCSEQGKTLDLDGQYVTLCPKCADKDRLQREQRGY